MIRRSGQATYWYIVLKIGQKPSAHFGTREVHTMSLGYLKWGKHLPSNLKAPPFRIGASPKKRHALPLCKQTGALLVHSPKEMTSAHINVDNHTRF